MKLTDPTGRYSSLPGGCGDRARGCRSGAAGIPVRRCPIGGLPVFRYLDFALTVAITIAFSTAAWMVVSDTRPAAPKTRKTAAVPAPTAAARSVRSHGAEAPAPSSPAPGLRSLLALIGLGSSPAPAAPPVPAEVWIEIFDSTTSRGSARAFDEHAQAKLGQPNGCAYHWVIGNGDGAADGAVEPTRRGAALRDGMLPEPRDGRLSLLVCLVGRFDRSEPSAAQKGTLVAFCRELCARYGVPPERVAGVKREGLSIVWLREQLRKE